MNNILQQLRKDLGLTQDEFAEKLFVTRQAVSRWENGETTPTIDTIRRITEVFGVDANQLMGVKPFEKMCIACGMPMKELKEFSGGDADRDYCVYCSRPDGTMMSYEEALSMAVRYCLEGDNYKSMNFKTRPTEAEARAGLVAYMATLPAWQGVK